MGVFLQPDAMLSWGMNLALPDWVPWWVPLVLLLPALLYGLAFLFMPFSVIGLKSRLESIDARLDDIQSELRHLAPRGAKAAAEFDDVYVPPPAPRRAEPVVSPVAAVRPVAPRPLHDDEEELDDRPPPPPHTRPVRRLEPPRQEPRVTWPRS